MTIYLYNVFSLPVYRIFIKNKKAFCTIVAIQMFLILAMRSEFMAADIPLYRSFYNYIADFAPQDFFHGYFIDAKLWTLGFESGYVLLNWICNALGLTFHDFLVVCAAINMVSFGSFIYWYSDSPCISFIIFAAFGDFFYCFAILRQMLSISVALWGVHSLMQDNVKRAIVFFVLAFSFHSTAILIFPLLFLYKIKIKRNYFYVFFLVFFLVMMFGSTIRRYIIPMILRLLNREGYDVITSGFMVTGQLLLGSVMIFAAYIIIDYEHERNKFLNIATWVLLMNVLFQIISTFGANLGRAKNWYTIFIAVAVPHLIVTREKSVKLLTQILIFFVMTLYMVIYLSNQKTHGLLIIPYQSIFQ